jgi:hypothetical protein
MMPANSNGATYDPVTWMVDQRIGVIYDNEARRWCMRTHVFVPGIGNRIYIEPLTEPLPQVEKPQPEPMPLFPERE